MQITLTSEERAVLCVALQDANFHLRRSEARQKIPEYNEATRRQIDLNESLYTRLQS